jgi:hypothetical protein
MIKMILFSYYHLLEACFKSKISFLVMILRAMPMLFEASARDSSLF